MRIVEIRCQLCNKVLERIDEDPDDKVMEWWTKYINECHCEACRKRIEEKEKV